MTTTCPTCKREGWDEAAVHAAGPAPEPVKPPAPDEPCKACDGRGWTTGWVEVHPYQEGCGACNGTGRTPAAGTAPTPEEGRFRCICPEKAKCPNCEWSCLYCRCERGTRP